VGDFEVANGASGFDPYTGEQLPDESPYQHPQTVRALFVALTALETTKKSNRKRNLPINAGKSWKEDEDNRLILSFDAGKSVKQIAEDHQRTEWAISSRLIKHDKIPS
jgi:hypothetical protein